MDWWRCYYLSRRDDWQSLCDRGGERCDERYSRRQCGSRESGTCCSQTGCLTFDWKSYFPDLSVPALLSLLGIRFPADSILIINDRERGATIFILFCLLDEPEEVKVTRKKFLLLFADNQSVSLFDENFLEK